MTRIKSVFFIVTFIVAVLWAQSVEFTFFDFPGAEETYPEKINNHGQVIGRYYEAGHHGFLRETDGSFFTIDPPWATQWVSLSDINDRGQVVGKCVDENGINMGLFRNSDGSVSVIQLGSMTEIFGINAAGTMVGMCDSQGFLLTARGDFLSFNHPGAGFTSAKAINDRGQIVGFYDLDGFRGFLRERDGTLLAIDPPGVGGIDQNWIEINNRGQIIATYGEPAERMGYLREPDGTSIPIAYPGAAWTMLTGINQRGEISGYCFLDPPGGYSHMAGFVRGADGSYTLVESPGAANYTQVMGINDRRQIVGCYDNLGLESGFMAILR